MTSFGNLTVTDETARFDKGSVRNAAIAVKTGALPTGNRRLAAQIGVFADGVSVTKLEASANGSLTDNPKITHAPVPIATQTFVYRYARYQ